MRIGRVTVGSLEMGEEKPPESRFNGCPLTLSDDSARECWIIHGTIGRLFVLALSDVRRRCNECDDRVGLGGVLREGVRLRWRLLEDDEVQTSSSQSLRLTTGMVSRPGGEGIHRRAELL